MKRMDAKAGFSPISIKSYVELHVKSNPDDKPKEVLALLQRALRDYKKGVKCECGNSIWVIGSAFVGNACFTCITGEANPDSDFEIDEAMK